MVQNNLDVESTAVDLTPIVRELIKEKEDIEKEMDTIGSDLSSDIYRNVGISKPLVDSEGFPLSGVDHHQVRSLRNRFAHLETDLASLFGRISESLHEIHESARISNKVLVGEKRPLVPFGRIDVVVPNSASDDAGLLIGDKLLSFGPIACYSPEAVTFCYDSIPGIVERISGDEFVEIKVRRVGRENEDIVLRIDPIGGKIGCLIKAL